MKTNRKTSHPRIMFQRVGNHEEEVTDWQSRRELIKNETPPFINLKRGGIIVNTKMGTIQFGIPPETIKVSANLMIH